MQESQVVFASVGKTGQRRFYSSAPICDVLTDITPIFNVYLRVAFNKIHYLRC